MYKSNGFTYPHFGTDLPRKFWDNLKSIDPNFRIFWHPWRTIWDDIMNYDTGSLLDPRFNINWYLGDKVFGWITTNGDGSPQPENSFHIWRFCPNAPGWAHILKIQSKHPKYLDLIINRLSLQAKYREKYGDHAWNKKYDEDTKALQDKQVQEKDNLFQDVQNENKPFMKKAMENFASGRAAPTNPQREVITSYKGQKNKSRIIRPLEDKEGGLYIPE